MQVIDIDIFIWLHAARAIGLIVIDIKMILCNLQSITCIIKSQNILR